MRPMAGRRGLSFSPSDSEWAGLWSEPEGNSAGRTTGCDGKD